jgi:HSP20 family protein
MLARCYPFTHDIWKDVDHIWDGLFEHGQLNRYYEPVQYTTEHAILTLDLPGVKKDDLGVSIVSDEVTVSGKRGKQEFKRTYSIDSNYDIVSAVAELEDGVLTVTFDRLPETKPKKIVVKVR